ncbi:MAG: AAA family ATPase, partial [Blastocatellia bacterium]
MVVYLKGDLEEPKGLDDLTPRQIVVELDKHVIGQNAAKRAVAIALRNRVRRQKLPADMAQDVMPKNIIMIGSTGVGKTEIARRLARLSSSPFVKVEASKFTEVGYVGRDVESMIRDLVEISVDMVRAEKVDEIADKAEQNVEERILDMLLPPSKAAGNSGGNSDGAFDSSIDQIEDTPTAAQETYNRTREKFRQQLREGRLDTRVVEMEVRERNFPSFEIITNQGVEEMDVNLKDMMPGLFGGRTKSRKMTVTEAMDYLMQ